VSKTRTPVTISSHVAELLREERERKSLSMTVLAGRAGLSQQSISYIERGLRIPNLDTLIRLTDALEIELWPLLKKATEKTRPQGN
jgi:transcriptional regulator with XRE-family HTH domain